MDLWHVKNVGQWSFKTKHGSIRAATLWLVNGSVKCEHTVEVAGSGRAERQIKMCSVS